MRAIIRAVGGSPASTDARPVDAPSRARPGRRAAAALVVAFATIGSAPRSAAEPFGLEQLMQGFARIRTSRADFVERKTLSSLDRPLESSGELVYVAPSRLERRTVKPKPETMIVDGDTLTIERGGTRRSVSLSSYPEAAAFTDSIRETLAGDLAALKRTYRVDFDGDASHWRLSLLPSDPKLATLISRVQLTGHDDRVEGIEILQADGDKSVATITPKAVTTGEPAR